MKVKYSCVVALSAVLFACDSSDDEDIVVDLTGTYNISAPSFTEFATDGGICGDGAGTLIIEDSVISGSVMVGNGVVFNVTGSVEPNGMVTGGFALSDETAVDFEGEFTDFVGFGSWVDNGGCNGAWQAILDS